MKRLIACLIAGLVLGVAGTASAADSSVRIGQVQIIDAYWAEMSVSYRCTGTEIEIVGGVKQSSDRVGGDLAAQDDFWAVPCTGRWEQVTLRLHYPTFQETGLEPGAAEAWLAIFGGASITRKVRL